MVAVESSGWPGRLRLIDAFKGFGWSKERIEVLLEKAREDLKNTRIHAYAECYVVYGMKRSVD